MDADAPKGVNIVIQEYLAKALAYEKQESWTKAAREYKAAANVIDDRNLKTFSLVCAYYCYIKGGLQPNARDMWREVQKIGKISRTAIAEQHLQEGNLHIAEVLCMEALKYEPENKENAFATLAIIQLERGSQKLAIEVLERMCLAIPTSIDAYFMRASCYESLENWGQAGRAYEEIRKFPEEWAEMAREKAYACYLAAKNNAKSKALWREICKKSKLNRIALAYSYAEEGREKVVQALTEVVLMEEPGKRDQVYECLIFLYKTMGLPNKVEEMTKLARMRKRSPLTLAMMRDYLTRNGWPVAMDEDNALLNTSWEGKHGIRQLVVVLNTETQLIQFLVTKYHSIVQERRLMCATLLLTLNNNSLITRFGMSKDSGDVELVANAMFGRHGISNRAFMQYINALVEADALYYSLIRQINETDLTIEDFLKKISSDDFAEGDYKYQTLRFSRTLYAKQ